MKLCTSDNRESELTGERHPDEINEQCHSDTRETELTRERNPDDINKLCNSDTRESELTDEWNPEEIKKPCTSAIMKVNSLLNETMMKPSTEQHTQSRQCTQR